MAVHITEVSAIAAIAFLLAYLGFIQSIAPPQYAIFGTFDFAFLGGSIIGVGGACAVATGLPCAAALAIFGVLSLLNFIIFNFSILKGLIVVPLVLLITFIIVKMSRGG